MTLSPPNYNASRMETGALTHEHIAELVRRFQAAGGLTPDGKFGPVTKAFLERDMTPAPFLRCPLPVLQDGRKAQITSEFRTTSRPNHDGVDLFYAWRAGDLPNKVGDGGAATRLPNGEPKWGVPFGTSAIAAAPGVVTHAASSRTGNVVWIDHGNGYRSGYFHLLSLRVAVGDHVETGAPLGLVGDNPADTDARHLHFEVSPVDRYEPINPATYLIA